MGVTTQRWKDTEVVVHMVRGFGILIATSEHLYLSVGLVRCIEDTRLPNIPKLPELWGALFRGHANLLLVFFSALNTLEVIQVEVPSSHFIRLRLTHVRVEQEASLWYSRRYKAK
jgi:hypothetical protein